MRFCTYFFGVVFAFVLLLSSVTIAQAVTFVVTKTADTNDGTCDADCSLREAIAAANAAGTADTINFDIPTSDGGYVAPSGSPNTTNGYFVIAPSTSLTPTGSAGLTINGYSQANASRNTADFGSTANTVLMIRVAFSSTAFFNLDGTSNNHITGLNLIGGASSSQAILFSNSASSNFIEGNYIGTDVVGAASSGVGKIGENTGSTSNIIGTDGDGSGDKGERNIISGVYANEILILSGTGTIIAGNYIGTDRTTRTCINSGSRGTITFQASASTRVGSNDDGVSDSEEANIISGCVTNTFRAVLKWGSGTSTGTVIRGNYIGTNTFGDNLGGTLPGVPGVWDRDGNVTDAIIDRNTIQYMTKAVVLGFTTSLRNKITKNIIYNSVVQDIDLGGSGGNGSLPVINITANDAGDVDTGANNLMNFPVLSTVTYIGSNQYQMSGTLDGKTSESPFTIEICLSNNNSWGYGGCTQYVGSISTTGGSWSTTFTVSGDDGLSARTFTSLAINSTNDTSEYSANLAYNPTTDYHPATGNSANPTLPGSPAPGPTTKKDDGTAGAAELLRPRANEVTGSAPAFSWRAPAEPDRVNTYRLLIDGKVLFTDLPADHSQETSDYIFVFAPSTHQYVLQPKHPLSDGVHTWSIQSISHTNIITNSLKFRFFVNHALIMSSPIAELTSGSSETLTTNGSFFSPTPSPFITNFLDNSPSSTSSGISKAIQTFNPIVLISFSGLLLLLIVGYLLYKYWLRR